MNEILRIITAALTLTACGTDDSTPRNPPNRTAASVKATLEDGYIVTDGVDLRNGACEFHWKDRMPYDGETVDGYPIVTDVVGETFFFAYEDKATSTIVFKLEGEFLAVKIECH